MRAVLRQATASSKRPQAVAAAVKLSYAPRSRTLVRALSSNSSGNFGATFTKKSAAFHTASGLQQQSAGSPAVANYNDLDSELRRMNEEVEPLLNDPVSVLKWAVEEFDGRLAMSTSFGIQSAILLHLATQVKPDIPVVWVDTGYLPAETYRYAQDLSETLNLNLHIASNTQWTPARMEAVHGKLWEKDDAESHGLYGRLRKVEPMKQTLNALEPSPLVLLSGLRASQTNARANMPPVGFQNGRFKILPILKMSDEEVDSYMDRFDLPQHPLRAQGYFTVGDWHSSRPVQEGEDPRATRFGGKFQECGLHVDSHEPVASAAESSPLAVPTVEAAPVAVEETVEILEPESLEKTGVNALGLTRVHEETDMAVIMVKKLTEDGTYCRKCNDVSEKIEQDHLSHLIGYTAVADVLDSTSEGSRLAKHFGVATAPFFLVRDVETEAAHGEWRVIRSYLQLRKLLEKSAEHKLSVVEHQGEDLLHTDNLLVEKARLLEEIKAQMDKLKIELHDKAEDLKRTQHELEERAQELGVKLQH